MLQSLERAKELNIQFDMEKIRRIAQLFDVAEALYNEREILDALEIPTGFLDKLLLTIEDEVRKEVAKIND